MKTYRVGDQIRAVLKRKLFSRGYEPNFESEVRVIEAVYNTWPKTYKISGRQQRFLFQELIPAENVEGSAKNYFIEKTRKTGGKTLRSGVVSGAETQHLLKARNDPSISTWISSAQLEKLKDDGLME